METCVEVEVAPLTPDEVEELSALETDPILIAAINTLLVKRYQKGVAELLWSDIDSEYRKIYLEATGKQTPCSITSTQPVFQVVFENAGWVITHKDRGVEYCTPYYRFSRHVKKSRERQTNE